MSIDVTTIDLTREPRHRSAPRATHEIATGAPVEPANPRTPLEPGIVPEHEPEREPWNDPGPAVREVDLPPNSPARGIPVENPEAPRREPPGWVDDGACIPIPAHTIEPAPEAMAGAGRGFSTR